MTIYVVTCQDYDQTECLEAFKSERLAEEHIVSQLRGKPAVSSGYWNSGYGLLSIHRIELNS
jgi:hypothetical protein